MWFIYTNISYVELAMTFWMIRQANTWKILKFKTPLHKLKLETFDPITINFTNQYSHIGAVTGIIESTTLDTDNLEIEFTVWLPVRLGEMRQYDFAYPVDDETKIFPATFDSPGGAGPGKDTDGNLKPSNGAGAKGIDILWSKRRRSRYDHGSPNPGTTNPEQPTIKVVPEIGPLGSTLRPNLNTPKFNQYSVPEYDSSNGQINRTVPGVILASGQSSMYRVRVYPKGLENPPVVTVAKSVDPTKPLIDGQWVAVITVAWTEEGQTRSEKVIVPSPSSTSVFPGRVISKQSVSSYTVRLYKNGLDNDGVVISGVRVLQIHFSETIPVDTWLLVGQVGDEYFMQPPIWLQ